MEGMSPLCLGGGTEHRAEEALVWVEQACGQALHCLGETGSELKLTISPREKLISNSQACPVSGRGWQLLIYQPPHKTTFENLPAPKTPNPLRELGLKH
jgi:hypothetical protein